VSRLQSVAHFSIQLLLQKVMAKIITIVKMKTMTKAGKRVERKFLLPEINKIIANYC
jgi:hypothetical protein